MIVLVGVVALALLGGFPLARGAQAAEDSYRVVVVAYPDLAGDGPRAPGCLGCDGRFSTADALRGREDGLPAVQVVLRDADGEELERAVSEPLPNGRQSVTLSVKSRGDYEIEIPSAPDGWEQCPGGSLKAALKADDFDRDTKTARVQFGFWRGCAALAAPAAMATETRGAPEAEATEAQTGQAPEAQTVATTAAVTQVVTTLLPTAMASPVAQATTVVTGAVTQSAAGEAVGSITGIAFLDTNRDGVRAGDESGAGGVVVALQGIDVTRSVTTTETGRYSFDNLTPGSYDIKVTTPDGYMLTTTANYMAIGVANDQVVGVDFGLVPLQAAAPAAAAVSPALPGAGAALPGARPWLLMLAAAAGVVGALGAVAERRSNCFHPSCSRKDS